MHQRWGITSLLILLLIAGCTRDAGVESFEPDGPSAATTAPQQQTALPTNDDAQSGAATAELTAEAQAEQPGVIITVSTPTDLPLLEITDTPQPPSPTMLPTQADATATSAISFTPGGPSSPSDAQTLPPPTAEPTVFGIQATEAADDTEASATEESAVVEPVLDERDGCTYTVQSGDNPFRIAVNNNITLSELREANPSLGGAGAVIQPGDVLEIPGCGDGTAVVQQDTSEDGGTTATTEDSATPLPGDLTEYTVVSGDTLGNIATRFNTTVAAIADANDITNVDSLSIGQVLLVPEGE